MTSVWRNRSKVHEIFVHANENVLIFLAAKSAKNLFQVYWTTMIVLR